MERIVAKFGGSSVADAAQFRKVAAIMQADPRRCSQASCHLPPRHSPHDFFDPGMHRRGPLGRSVSGMVS